MFRFIFIIFFFTSSFASANNNETIDKLVKKFTSINNLQFNFIQKTEALLKQEIVFYNIQKN
jgi:outer membrane lipoprotein-sorting protein